MPPSVTVLNANDAIARHVQWKITLQLAITLKEPLSAEHVEQIRNHHRCAIGIWLDSAATLIMRRHPACADLVQKHLQFHREMGAVAALIAEARWTEAARSVDARSSFTRSSQALAMAIMPYDAGTPIAVPFE